ncbi:MAG: ferrous iron transport protein B [Planctomycetia bacterium]|nr:ferrous iron transport protein B [Planctomycetia bacterium]
MVHSHCELLVAIVGQPNGGKSTVFRLLTKSHSEISNYPGITMDAQSGHYHEGNRRIEVVDLPGSYSFSSSTQEERISKNFVLLDRPEVVIDVMDASNFRRHLFLFLELMEMQVPVVVCLNMMDIAKRRGIQFDQAKLEQLLAVPVIPFIATKEDGLDELRSAILKIADQNDHAPTRWKIDYGPIMEECLQKIESGIRTKPHLAEDFSPRWLAVKLMENDREARRIVEHHTHDDSWRDILDFCDEQFNHFINQNKCSPRKIILERRNQFASQIEQETISRLKPRTIHFSDRIDSIACHPIFGPFLLFLIMILTFQLTFKIADGWKWFPLLSMNSLSLQWLTPVEFLALLFSQIIPNALDSCMQGTQQGFRNLLIEGILPGVGGVVQFVPVIFVMFSMLSVLEQSGYIARVAMIMDRFMRRFGLQGQSILPMVLGGGITGGCAVPAILMTRSISNLRQRILTILVIPMLNCGGKVPVYTMIIAAFFASHKGLMMGAIVLFSWGISLVSAWILGKTLVRGKELPLLLELPTYQFPRIRDVFENAARQSGEFLKKAGTVILGANILLWLLLSYPKLDNLFIDIPESKINHQPITNLNIESNNQDKRIQQLESSYAAAMGRLLEPVSRFAGFDWRDNVALLSGLGSKELIISSMSMLYQSNQANRPNQSNQSIDQQRNDLVSNKTQNKSEIEITIPVDSLISQENEVNKTFELVENPFVLNFNNDHQIYENEINQKSLKISDGSPSESLLTLREYLKQSPNWTFSKAVAMLVFIMLYVPCSGTLIAIYRTTGCWRWVLISFLYNTILAFLLAIIIFQLGIFL